MDENTERLLQQGRCCKCKNSMTGVTHNCKGCHVYKYCSQECLEADKQRHVLHCHLLGVQSGIHRVQLSDRPSENKPLKSGHQVKKDYSAIYGDLDDSDDSDRDKPTGIKEKGSVIKDESNLSCKSKQKVTDTRRNSNGNSNNSGNTSKDGEKMQGKKVSLPGAVSSDGASATNKASSVSNQPAILRRCWKCKKESYVMKACNRCHTAAYCDQDCQRKNLKNHEDFCLQFIYKDLTMSERLKASGNLPGSPGLEDFEALPETGNGTSDSEIKACSRCRKKSDSSDTLKKCGRCRMAAYCNKECQKADYKQHKDFCRRKFRFEEAKSKVYPYVKSSLDARKMPLNEELAFVTDEFQASVFGANSALLLEIIGPYPHLFRYGIQLQDITGSTTFALFYTQTDHYPMPKARGNTLPVPLPMCLQPGNFLLILEPSFHFFMDGTVGFRINSIDEVHFIQIM